MTSKDIPDSMMANIREAFDRDPKVVEMRIHQHNLERSGNFHAALDVAEKIDYLFTRVVQEYIEEAEKECKNIHLNETGMPEQDIESLLECVVTLFMACDVIETAIMDANDIIHRTDKGLHFEMFDDLSRLSKMVRDKLQFMQENSGYGKDIVWADKCDNMYDMMRNKARSIIRKRKAKEEQQ